VPLQLPSVGIGTGVSGGQAEGVSAEGADRKGIGIGSAPAPITGVGTGRNPCADGRAVCDGPVAQPGNAADSNQILSGREVTQKARVTSKPEPQYTESAR
jgi:hypothetical protein